jgi:hypothetical protein
MKPGDLVRCKIWGKIGVIIGIPKHDHAVQCSGAFKLVNVMWADGTQIVHVNNVEPLNAAG